MIKLSYEFDTEQEAINFLTHVSQTLDKSFANPPVAQYAPVAAPAPAVAPAPAAPAPLIPTPAAQVLPPAAPAPVAAPAISAAPAPAPVASGPTAKDVGQAAQAYSKKYGPKAAKAVLAQFGLTQLNAATPDQYATLIQHFSA